jgi:hypothetical protein
VRFGVYYFAEKRAGRDLVGLNSARLMGDAGSNHASSSHSGAAISDNEWNTPFMESTLPPPRKHFGVFEDLARQRGLRASFQPAILYIAHQGASVSAERIEST